MVVASAIPSAMATISTLSCGRTDLNAVLKRILESGYVTSATGERLTLHSHTLQDEGEFLQQVIQQIKPRTSLEVGCAYGVSSLYICEALAAVGADRHIIIDPYQHEHWHGLGIEHLKAAGYGSLIELHELPSHQALPRLEAAATKLDFVFIDGAHWFDYVMVDFFCVDRMLNVGGVIVFDDADWAGVGRPASISCRRHTQYFLRRPAALTGTPRGVEGLHRNTVASQSSGADLEAGGFAAPFEVGPRPALRGSQKEARTLGLRDPPARAHSTSTVNSDSAATPPAELVAEDVRLPAPYAATCGSSPVIVSDAGDGRRHSLVAGHVGRTHGNRIATAVLVIPPSRRLSATVKHTAHPRRARDCRAAESAGTRPRPGTRHRPASRRNPRPRP